MLMQAALSMSDNLVRGPERGKKMVFVLDKQKKPLKDAATVNAARYKVVGTLQELGLPIGSWSGGRTRWNRARFGLRKTHALDALCVGDLAGVKPGELMTVRSNAARCGRSTAFRGRI